MKFEIDGKLYNVIVVRKNNKNSYIRVKDDLTIQVTTSYFVTTKYIEKMLKDNALYLRKIISKKLEQNSKSTYDYLGNSYEIIICNLFDKIEFTQDKIIIPSEKEFNKYIKNKTLELFKERLDYNYNKFEENIPYPCLKIRNMKTRWGVCNIRDNSITLNSKLIEKKIEALDYVIIHELSHFIHFNHSASFWALVSKYEPNYKDIRKYLRD
ncbi:MAG: M48 family metallopeptidase [Clostridium sp.]|nr:M48 family metallopeptidase [Clostridium sp.]MCM1444549.1 M48 family metallopeptidase [Candidatus Amulumruptor caecigallinarius]